jgi:putative transposase
LLLDQRKHELRQVFNAIFYVVKGGIPWRLMPKDLPPWQRVYYYYAKFSKLGIWQELNDALPEKVRAKKGRKVSPSAAILDSQSVKTTLVGGGAALMQPSISKAVNDTSCRHTRLVFG